MTKDELENKSMKRYADLKKKSDGELAKIAVSLAGKSKTAGRSLSREACISFIMTKEGF